MSSYFMKYRNRVQGPFSEAELKAMAGRNELSALHTLSTDRQHWTPATEVKGLFPEAARTPPPPAPDTGTQGDFDVLDAPAAPPGAPHPPQTHSYLPHQHSGYPPSQPQPPPGYSYQPSPGYGAIPHRGKNKTTAGILALFLGGLGIHDFYLGAWGWGIASMLFFWTGIPAIWALVEAIALFTMDDGRFDAKYNYKQPGPVETVFSDPS